MAAILAMNSFSIAHGCYSAVNGLDVVQGCCSKVTDSDFDYGFYANGLRLGCRSWLLSDDD